MKISDLPFAVLRFQYWLARFPFEFIEQRVVARMDSEAPAGCCTSVPWRPST